jgi:EmrB/QacA subfamily drug resistance transporter
MTKSRREGLSRPHNGLVSPVAAEPPRATVLAVSLIAAFLAPFMSSAMNIALPSIGRELHLDAVILGWTATVYLLSSALFLLPFGRIADIHGRNRIFLWGAVLNTAASILCAAAGTVGVLLAGRVLQGLGGAMVFSTGVAMLTSAYPASERGRVLGLNVACTYIGLSLGPVLGGILTQHLGWRSIFLVNAGISLVLVAATAWRLGGDWCERREETLDVPGSLYQGLALVALMLGLSRLPRLSGGLLIAAAGVFLAAFVAREKRARHPLVDLNHFRSNPVFAFSNLAALINYSATSAAGFLLSLYLQYITGLTPQKAGLILLAQPAMMALFSPLAGRLSDRVEPRYLASAGMAISASGLFLLSFLGPATGLPFVVAALLVLGFGFALFSSPNTNAVMSSVERRDLGLASAVLSTMRLTGQMLSMGLTVLLFSLIIGRAKITPDVHPQFLHSARLGFLFFAALCVGGVFASLARGHLRKV